MALRNAFENLGLDSTLQAIRDRLPAALGGRGGVKVEQQGSILVEQPTASSLKVDLSGTAVNATAIKVDGSAVTQGVSGTVTANQGGTWTVQPGNTVNTSPWLITQTPSTSGGLTIYRNLDMGITGVEIKSSAGQIYGYYIANNASSVRYVKLYNAYSGSVPASTDSPVITLPIPANAAANVSHPNGVAFGTKIGIRASTGVGDSDNTAPTANDVIVNIFYK